MLRFITSSRVYFLGLSYLVRELKQALLSIVVVCLSLLIALAKKLHLDSSTAYGSLYFLCPQSLLFHRTEFCLLPALACVVIFCQNYQTETQTPAVVQ